MKTKSIYITFLLSLVIAFQSLAQTARDSIANAHRTFGSALAEKYNGNDFNYEIEQDSYEPSLGDKILRFLQNLISDIFGNTSASEALSGFQILIRVLAVIVILFVVYLIVRMIINKEGGWIFSRSSKKINVTENVEENIHTIDFNKIVKDAVGGKDFRVAIRYYYLWLLKSLSDRNIIEWDIEKTNSDYLYEINDMALQKDFRFLSYVYEYSWYGEFELTEEDFQKAQKAFLKSIGKQ
ncbi:DUF4129 domain-containing protein [Flavobacterium sediminis]|uniref:DUF4129 domain-containing protein n=1 Tax=Flavobacterium sediminis TaxID=2201181 RepID=A0A2U8QR86_9FLAO|nr:DUF4129 domain-containing protein [Flavobacterium sediminis]AWM12640.1 DUF4129 domain-containing protein [Flavobacterium sediminis]